MSILEATSHAVWLLVTGDMDLWQVIGTTLGLATIALAAATPVAIGCAYVLAAHRFPGRRVAIALFHALLATPTVVVGLLLFLLLSSAGPLGALGLLFTPTAVAAGQFIIALPILVAFSFNALEADVHVVRETAITLGASNWQALVTVLAEARRGLAAALLAGFGRIVSEVGCALLVGGNIVGSTRTIPTAIALDTGQGRFAEGIALGVVLLTVAVLTSFTLFLLQRSRRA